MKHLKKVNPKYGASKKIQKEFGVSRVSVSHALNGRTNSKLAKEIRKMALDLGGDPIYEND